MSNAQIKIESLDAHLHTDDANITDPDYLAWKEAKVRRALEQSQDREQMIAAKDVWDAFGLEH